VFLVCRPLSVGAVEEVLEVLFYFKNTFFNLIGKFGLGLNFKQNGICLKKDLYNSLCVLCPF